MIKYLDLQRLHEEKFPQLREIADVVVKSGWYLRGPHTQSFEQHYAEYIGTQHCVACGNGLDALSLILQAYKELGVMHDGDEIIVPANTYIASILAITKNRLVPVLVEPDIATLQIDDSLIEQAITERTKGIMLVHLYGILAYTEKIGELCRKYDLKLIEDNAQAHGCTYLASRRTGSLGHAAAHSFYPTKNLGALGDAGAVTTDDGELADLIRALGNYGSGEKYVFDHIGSNSRMDEMQAAILDEKLKYLDESNEWRKELAAIYKNKVKNPLIRMPKHGRDSVFHIFPILCERRDELKAYLLSHGVETEVHYPIPPHRQRCYREWNTLSLPVTEQIHAQELSLPCHWALTKEEVNYIVDLLNRFT